MTTAMERTWNRYEAEKATGNAETAEMIGDVYTALDMIETDGAEANEEYLLKTYYGICKVSFQQEGFKQGELFEIRMGLENAMVEAGLLEADEEPEDEEEELDYTNDAQHWDEWVADQRYDMYRDLALMGYEY